MAKPFLKWVGGKRRLVPELMKHVPEKFSAYYEPFLGSGAMFFALEEAGLLKGKLVELSDANTALTMCYGSLQCKHEVAETRVGTVRAIAEELEKLLREDSKSLYEAVREDFSTMHRSAWCCVPSTASFIYLNRTCFNGLWRVNSSGKFNVPYGHYSKPRIPTLEDLNGVSMVLGEAYIEDKPFHHVDPSPGGFVYLDPPYVGTKGGFVGYCKDGWTERHQLLLLAIARFWKSRRVHVLISDAATDSNIELYEQHGFEVHLVETRHSVSAKAAGRGKVKELLAK